LSTKRTNFERNFQFPDENWLELLRCYKENAAFLNKTGDYNLNFVYAILNQLLPVSGNTVNSELHEYLVGLAIELTQIREKQFGILSLEFVKDSTYLLDLTAIREIRGLVEETLTKVKESFSILPSSIKAVYVCYMNNYLNC
jgi:hypothetical protein